MVQRSGVSRKSSPEIVWKIVDAQCAQLADAVKAARIPFLLALSWAFLWGWSLYSSQYGYLASFYRHRIAESISFKDSKEPTKRKQFEADCARVTAMTLNFEKDSVQDEKNDVQDKECLDALTRRRDWAEKAFLDSTAMSFPGGFAKIEVSDLGLVGQVGLLLILSWLFYSTRRENHAIRAFVDLDENTRRLGYLFPNRFILIPQDKYLSAEHLTFAYHAVAQRFMFILSRYNRPLLRTTIVLISLPGVIAAWHVLSDIEGVVHYNVFSLTLRFGTSVLLLGFVGYVTWIIIEYVIETSVILNGWYLASTRIWMHQWSETGDLPASTVEIDMVHQTAHQVRPAKE
jgi:hypothetical protein